MTRTLVLTLPLILLAVGFGPSTCYAEMNQDLLDHFEAVSHISALSETNVFMLELDVTGDDLKEIFLCPQAIMGVGSLLVNFVYSPLDDRGSYRYLGSIGFNIYGFRFDEKTSRLVVMAGGEKPHTAYLLYYKFDSTGIHEVEREPYDVKGEEPGKQMKLNHAWRESKGIVLLKAPLQTVKKSLLKEKGEGEIHWQAFYGKEDRTLSDVVLRGKVISEVKRK